jgi:membrane protein involved in colicin uptake
MPAALLKLIPFRDYLYAAIAIVAIVFYNVHVHELEAHAVEHERAAIQAETARVERSAQARLAAQAQDYADREAATEDAYEKQIQADDAAHAADLERLRQLATQGSGSPTLPGSASPEAPPDSGRSSLVGLGYVSEELATALRDAREDLGKCYAERDALTGK